MGGLTTTLLRLIFKAYFFSPSFSLLRFSASTNSRNVRGSTLVSIASDPGRALGLCDVLIALRGAASILFRSLSFFVVPPIGGSSHLSIY